jgi:imidazole glycerol-phosphate synthase subunit HisF
VIVNRVVPVLLLHEGMLVKTTKFKSPRYVGDPINAVRIFNEKEVDELVVLDMDPARGRGAIRTSLLEEIASEAFMPVAYGGGITSAEAGRSLVGLGIEKLVVNTAQATAPRLIPDLASVLGSQAVVASVDFARGRRGTETYTQAGSKRFRQSAVERAQAVADLGAGEILLHSVDRDGTMAGYDLDAIRQVAAAVDVPVLACGGAGDLKDMRAALDAGASAVAAGSMFVFHGRHRAVLITYPERREVADLMGPPA